MIPEKHARVCGARPVLSVSSPRQTRAGGASPAPRAKLGASAPLTSPSPLQPLLPGAMPLSPGLNLTGTAPLPSRGQAAPAQGRALPASFWDLQHRLQPRTALLCLVGQRPPGGSLALESPTWVPAAGSGAGRPGPPARLLCRGHVRAAAAEPRIRLRRALLRRCDLPEKGGNPGAEGRGHPGRGAEGRGRLGCAEAQAGPVARRPGTLRSAGRLATC